MERILNKLTEMLETEPILNRRNAYELRGDKLLMGLLLKKSGKVFLQTAPGFELSTKFDFFKTRYIKDNYISNAAIIKTEEDIQKMLEILNFLANNRELIRPRKNKRSATKNKEMKNNQDEFESNLVNIEEHFANQNFTEKQTIVINSFIKNYNADGVTLETISNDTEMKVNTVRIIVVGLVKRALLKLEGNNISLNI